MTIPERVMIEVIESDKQVIVRLTNEVVELKELLKVKDAEISDLKKQVQELLVWKNKHKCIIINEEMKKNNKNDKKYNIEENHEYIKLKQINFDLQSKLEGLTSNIEDNVLFKQLKVQNALLSENNKTLNDNLYKLNQDFESFKNSQGLPTPSNSDDMKNKKNNKNNKNNKKGVNVSLPENIYDVVYYRYVNNNRLPSYFTRNGKAFLNCCGKGWDYKELTKNGVTCLKCYKTYKLNDNNKLINEILESHIISDEKEILKKLKCNKCDLIYKKEINLCTKCNKIEKGNNFLKTYKTFTKPDENDLGYNCKILAASETYIKLKYLHSLYYTAQKDGVDTSNMKELIDYIKSNKLLEEKQYNIIKFKIQRAHSIMLLYKDEKYKPILDYIKRINFKVKELGCLMPDHWSQFRIFIEKDLNEELNKYLENSNITDTIKNVDTLNSINNESIKINFEKFTNECCIKCDTILNDDELGNCSKCMDLCITDDCFNNKSKMVDKQIDYCKAHANKIFSFDFQI